MPFRCTIVLTSNRETIYNILITLCYKDILIRGVNHDDDHTYQKITLAYAASNQFPEEVMCCSALLTTTLC